MASLTCARANNARGTKEWGTKARGAPKARGSEAKGTTARGPPIKLVLLPLRSVRPANFLKVDKQAILLENLAEKKLCK